MSLTSSFIVYAMAFRLAVIAAGVVAIYLGYQLFLRGIFSGAPKARAGEAGTPADSSPGGTEITAEAGGNKLTVKNAAPGTCFAAFGAIIVAVMVVEGIPELSIDNAARLEAGLESPVQISLNMKGSPKAATADGGAPDLTGFRDWLERGVERQNSGDRTGAIEAYGRALSDAAVPLGEAATALNQVAWLFQEDGRLEEALALARLAVQAKPGEASFLDTLAVVQLKRGEAEDAVAWARKAELAKPGDAGVLHTLATALAAAGRRDEAIQVMERAAADDPSLRPALAELRARAN